MLLTDFKTIVIIFSIDFRGGSAAKYLSEHLPKLETDWTKWRVFFCDERHVPYDDPECTFNFYKTNLFSKVPIPENCIFPDDPSVSGCYLDIGIAMRVTGDQSIYSDWDPFWDLTDENSFYYGGGDECQWN